MSFQSTLHSLQIKYVHLIQNQHAFNRFCLEDILECILEATNSPAKSFPNMENTGWKLLLEFTVKLKISTTNDDYAFDSALKNFHIT